MLKRTVIESALAGAGAVAAFSYLGGGFRSALVLGAGIPAAGGCVAANLLMGDTPSGWEQGSIKGLLEHAVLAGAMAATIALAMGSAEVLTPVEVLLLFGTTGAGCVVADEIVSRL